MKCPKCQAENMETQNFCGECGAKLEKTCPGCGAENPPKYKFCGECGHNLSLPLEQAPKEACLDERIAKIQKHPPKGLPRNILAQRDRIEDERKHVTVLFSDLSGYTAMCETLDPEDVKEIVSRIFGVVAQVIAKYEGFIEKFIGDAVVAIFGVPKAHEDDPVRAIRAAREIHKSVEDLSIQFEKKVGKPFTMHTGINTGLVVTGEVKLDKGTHGIAGDTINLAARLQSLAKSGEILVGEDTYRKAEGYFNFEKLQPTKVKGRAELLRVYKVHSPKKRPITVHRLSGLRADFIGRKSEMAQLKGAVQDLLLGKGTVFSIRGDAGAGKSRLVEELKSVMDLEKIQWREGRSYSYSQNIPYSQLIDLLNKDFQIEEVDPLTKVRDRIQSGVERLVRQRKDIVPYIGSLYGLTYPEVQGMSPELFRFRLQEAFKVIFSALVQRAPTLILLEDLHWADASSVELLRNILLESLPPAIFLCVYRPNFSLFADQQIENLTVSYREVHLQVLSSQEIQEMLESLLATNFVPPELVHFIHQKTEGNPFYVEELVNSLIESSMLVKNNGTWTLIRPISDLTVPSTINGVISARIDRLQRNEKKVLQEASVIGRIFPCEILKKVTEIQGQVDRCLLRLEQIDLIRKISLEPELEFTFKHVLTQEAVYNGLTKKDRQKIHERIALVIEKVLLNRLPEFYETLAFHYTRAGSINHAVDYLLKSGVKNMEKYALKESHQYFKEAFDLVVEKPDKSNAEESLLIDVINKWAFLFYYYADYGGLIDLLKPYEALAKSLNDKSKLGMYYCWLGKALEGREYLREAYEYLIEALKLGEEADNLQVIGYACTWLSWTCSDLGNLDEAITYGARGQEISMHFKSDQELFRNSLVGMAMAYWWKGDRRKTAEIGHILLDYGQKQSDIRSTYIGHLFVGCSYVVAGDLPKSIDSFEKAIQVSVDPAYSVTGRVLLGMSCVADGRIRQAETCLEDVMNFNEKYGYEWIGRIAEGYLGILMIAKGNLSKGTQLTQKVIQACQERESRYRYCLLEYMLGKVYLQLYEGAGPKKFSFLVNNIGFLLKNLPFASRKAKHHFNKAILAAKAIGAKGILAQAYLDLGHLYSGKRRNGQAYEYFCQAIQIFEQCEAEVYLKQAKDALASLG